MEQTPGQAFAKRTQTVNDTYAPRLGDEGGLAKSEEGGDKAINDHKMNERKKSSTKHVRGGVVIGEAESYVFLLGPPITKKECKQFVRGGPRRESTPAVA